MSKDNKKIIILNYQKESDQSAILRSLEKMYEKHANVDVQFIANGAEAAQVAKMYPGGLFLFSVFDKRDVAQILTFIAGTSRELQDGTFKMAGYNNLNNKKLEKYLSQNGCAEEFYGRLTPKTLSYKITLWFKAIDFSVSKVADRKRIEEENKASEIRFTSPMRLASDCWLLEKKDDVHNTLRQWFIEIVGPSPCAGRWVEIENKKDHYDKYWEWKPKMEQEFPFITDLGNWIFKGVEPKFSWKNNSWQFTGKDIYLGFYHQESDQIDYRFTANEQGADVCENSTQAQAKREMIIESCDPKYHVENEDLYQKKDAHFEKEGVGDVLRGELDNDGDAIDGMMRGNGLEEKTSEGHYRGELEAGNERQKKEYKEETLDLNLFGKKEEVKEEAENANNNRIDDRLRGKVGSSLSLDIEESNEKENKLNPDTPYDLSPKAKSHTSLDIAGADAHKDDEHDDELEKEKKKLSVSLNLDLDKLAERQAKEAEEDRKKREELLAKRKLALVSPEEEREKALEEERKKLKQQAKLDLPMEKDKSTDPHEGQVDHLQKYYGFVHEMGLTPDLTADEEARSNDEIKKTTAPVNSNREQSTANLSPTASKPVQRPSQSGLPHQNSNEASEEGANQKNTQSAEQRKRSALAQGQQGTAKNQGMSSVDKMTENDLDGQGSRADHIEKYYGTKKRELPDDDPKARAQHERNKDNFSGSRLPIERENKIQPAKELDLFSGDKVNLQDIKLLVQIIRKSKGTGIFDDKKPVELNDLFDNYMVFSDMAHERFLVGERVLIKVDCSYLGRNNFYDFFGTITEVEQNEDDAPSDDDIGQNLCVELTKFEKKHLEEMSRVFFERQANILKFFKAAKGLE